MTKPINSILIANRFEIACRIIQTARKMGLQTIAVHSDADSNAPHVKIADRAILIGPGPAAQSYLNQDRILEAIAQTGADAVHPGYGFLSENAAFADACEKNDIIFIGPKKLAIEVMGDKAKSKQRMIESEVACIPGYQGEDQSDQAFLAHAEKIDFPLMVKASAGGGGRGMRFVEKMSDLEDALKLARDEAQNAFGSDDLILERALLNARHVEIQILADNYGKTVHLGERDCSVQRRHQKIIEESPCPVMTPQLRERMGLAACRAAQSVGYTGAGTVEFLLDDKGEFYFLEMNTRLQVEHPVTEMVTGLDLVEWQIKIARGEKISFDQNHINLDGHAIEARLYAEDPAQQFLPSTGRIDLWQAAPDIRIDNGIETGSEISPYYDPMVAKIIAHGKSREDARLKLVRALKETTLYGVTTNKAFLIDALNKETFIEGTATTSFMEEHYRENSFQQKEPSEIDLTIGAMLMYENSRAHAKKQAINVPENLMGWSSAHPITAPFQFEVAEQILDFAITPLGNNLYEVIGKHKHQVEILGLSGHRASLKIDGAQLAISFHIPRRDPTYQTIQLTIDGHDFELVNLIGRPSRSQDTIGAGSILAPMHGLLVSLKVVTGQNVQKGDTLAVLEAMKMQHEILADMDGTISEIHYTENMQISADALLLEINP